MWPQFRPCDPTAGVSADTQHKRRKHGFQHHGDIVRAGWPQWMLTSSLRCRQSACSHGGPRRAEIRDDSRSPGRAGPDARRASPARLAAHQLRRDAVQRRQAAQPQLAGDYLFAHLNRPTSRHRRAAPPAGGAGPRPACGSARSGEPRRPAGRGIGAGSATLGNAAAPCLRRRRLQQPGAKAARWSLPDFGPDGAGRQQLVPSAGGGSARGD